MLRSSPVNEAEFVRQFQQMAAAITPPGHRLEVGLNLYYEVVVDNRLRVRTDVRKPMRGQSAFQTDLCLVEVVSEGDESPLLIPRVVFEFKMGITTHDVLTYNAKARKHKNVYPYLRYGIVIAAEQKVPRKFFVHNDSLDFCLAVGALATDPARLRQAIGPLIAAELAASRQMEAAAFGRAGPDLFRTEVVLGYLDGAHKGVAPD